ncbi:hypothetical protein F4806DRAFT_98030 [Annulohypoxylon nitens]|nr:hypothetical protein F4806DRAFT_98030 [Annulohypoxylon nitens]
MEKVVCSCASCNAYFGEFFNQWIKISKSYISPVIDTDEISSVTLTGAVRLGDKETLIENCYLQDLACTCGAVIGLRCLETPVNHVLRNGQLFLRLSSVQIKSLHTHKLVEIKVQRTLKLREASHGGSPLANEPPDHDVPSEIHGHLLDHLQAQLDAQREETQRLNKAGFQMASSFDSAVLRIEGEVKKLKDGMVSLKEEQNDSSNNVNTVDEKVDWLRVDVEDVRKTLATKSAYARLDEEVATAKSAVADVRTYLSDELGKWAKKQQRKQEILATDLSTARVELGTLRDELDGTKKTISKKISAEDVYIKEVASLGADLKELRDELAKERSKKSPPREPVFPSREIDILTTNITKIGQRANQVEALQMELEILRERVQRMENGPTPRKQDESNMGDRNSDSINSLPKVSGRKRKHSARLKEASLPMSPTISSSKKPTRSLRSNSPLTSHDPLFSSPLVKARGTEAQTPSSPRLTKSGEVDKRCMRRLTRLAAAGNSASND